MQFSPVKTDYNRTLYCMEGTRKALLNRIIAWVTNDSGEDEGNTYWIHGLPGTGKTSLAHSICEKLHDQQHLAGAFFCRRDDPNLSEPRNILPTLIYKLSEIFPPFRRIVAEYLRNDPNLTPESMKGNILSEFIHGLPRQPDHALVFIIDAIDECGDNRSRQALLAVLKVLTDAAAHARWLKIIVTGRPEIVIQRFFDAPTRSSHVRQDPLEFL